MTPGADFLQTSATALDAARKLATEDYGALPICDGDRLQGMITDRDIVVKVIDLVQGEVVTIGADDSVDEALKTMAEHQVRRLPVVDGTTLVGMLSQADVATNADERKVGAALEDISQP